MVRALVLLAACLWCANAAADFVFTALVDGQWRTHHQKTAGAKPVPLGDKSGDHGAPILSPDKSRLAYEIAGKGTAICQVAAATCRAVAADGGFFSVRPVWLAADDQLAMVRYQVDSKREDSSLVVYRMGPDLRQPGQLRPLLDQTGNQDYPAVSSDGRYLAYSSAQLITVHRAATRVTQALWQLDRSSGITRPLTQGNWQDIHAAFSGNGRWLSFASNRDGQFEIYLMNLASGAIRRLTDGPGPKTWPRWLPSDREISYTRVNQGRYEIWVQALDSDETLQVFPFGRTEADPVQIRDGEFR
ncbi:hypothetical protein FKG94_01075 [Exilibacterium tricleocarpae]|uniref:Uncharacterized protein n=1 Tax=Exilibacterium tricleocarpae TaxID=2591008 RepID=A0A545U9N1_9GAMM|nr:PD40 domain-containing protein [Exilibacterium tricleocarpae]TQV86177.1 hypothetical protein FKG94_01075 [Exilibacterium tricleocarpae]